MSTTARPEEIETRLLGEPRDGRIRELVDGEIRVTPAGARHGRTAMRLVARLGSFTEERALGDIFGPDTGFRLASGNVRCPDVSFVARGRFPDDRAPEGFAELAPDLAVEILSPSERPRALLDRVGEYLEAGVRLVWVIDPEKQRAVEYRSLTQVSEFGAEDTLDGGDVIPGFRCRLLELV